MVKIAIVDDNASYRQTLQEYLKRYEQENGESMSVTVFGDGDEIVEGYRNVFDIILMDVEMRFMDGMEAAREIRRMDPEVVIIFITNMAQYAIRGYEVDALDYVLKPVSYFAFSQRLDRALTRRKRRTSTYITVPTKGGMRKIDASEIYFVESRDHDLTYHTASGDFHSGATMRQAEEQLETAHFFRGNNSYLINLEHIDGVEDGCALVHGEALKLSRPRKKAFLDALADYLSEVIK
jgi:DNA-binding LytR/AlgR family response regulator